MSLKVGDIITFERTFPVKDVESFTKVSDDEGSHHVTPDEQGRLVMQGLLTATLPTKIGGDNKVIARAMNFEFLRPVFTGDTIICVVNWKVALHHYSLVAMNPLPKNGEGICCVF